jgi:filamentous hemagglutinin family protein
MPQPNFLISLINKWTARLGLVTIAAIGLSQNATAQIVGNGDTVVTPNGNQLAIDSGTTIGPNQFFSFDQFSVNAAQTAIFQNRDNVTNVLAKVSGGSPSYISGQIQFLNGSPNLYLMNPAGILFGSSAQLDLRGGFMATTASGIGFGDTWWDVQTGFGNQIVDKLDQPTALRFSPGMPGAIVNLGSISVPDGQPLSLIGGTVISAGSLSAPSGKINIATVPGDRLVQLNLSGSLLGIAVPGQAVPALNFNPLTIPALITGAGSPDANQLVINPNGSIQLKVTKTLDMQDNTSNRDIAVQAGDIYFQQLGDANNLAERLAIQSQGYLYGQDLSVIDTSGIANISLKGDRGIDVNSISTISTGKNTIDGDISLVSSQGSVTVSTIINRTGGIFINANQQFQAVGITTGSGAEMAPISLRSLKGVTIQHANPDVADFNASEQNLKWENAPLDVQGNGAVFLIGPNQVNGVFSRKVLPDNVSGTAGAIELRIPRNGIDPNNEAPIVYRNLSFGTSTPSPGEVLPPPINVPPNPSEPSVLPPNQDSIVPPNADAVNNPVPSINNRLGSIDRPIVESCQGTIAGAGENRNCASNQSAPNSEESAIIEDESLTQLLTPKTTK